MFRKREAPVVQFTSIETLDEELRHDEESLASQPFTTTLTPQELYLLNKAGYEPFQVVVGTIVYSMGMRGVLRSFVRAFQRGEMADFSHLQRVARELAIARMRDRAHAVGCVGVVGTTIYFHEYADFIEVIATGTAVKKSGTTFPDTEVVLGA